MALHAPSTLAAYQLRQQGRVSGSSNPTGPSYSLPAAGTTPPAEGGASLLWQVALPEVAQAAAFDATGGGRLAVYCARSGHLMQLGPLNTHSTPQRISLHERCGGGGSSAGGAGGGGTSGGGGSSSPATVAGGGAGSGSGAGAGARVVSLSYSLHESDHLYILRTREMVLWDLAVGAALSSIRLDRTDHDFTSIIIIIRTNIHLRSYTIIRIPS